MPRIFLFSSWFRKLDVLEFGIYKDKFLICKRRTDSIDFVFLFVLDFEVNNTIQINTMPAFDQKQIAEYKEVIFLLSYSNTIQ